MVLKEGEVLNDLLGFEGLKIIQHPEMFNFSLDSTLLADFVVITKRINTILDLGTGFAPIPLMLSRKTAKPIVGVEIQQDVSDVAKRNVKLNELDNQITVLNEDIKNLKSHFDKNSFNLITCNPPFFKHKETSNINKNDYKTIARHEVKVNLKGIVDMAAYLLQDKGHFVLVHRPERLQEIITLFMANSLEMKRLRFIHPKQGEDAYMVLIDAVKRGNKGLKILPPLIVHNHQGYTQEALVIFNVESK